MFAKVLVPLDSSDDTSKVSAAILPYVSYLARGLNIPVVLTSILDSDTTTEAQLEVEQQIGSFVHGLNEQGVQVSSVVVTAAEPTAEILRLADQQGCDLIAMATRDRNLLGQSLMGSTTNEVVRNASVPVLAITPEKEDRDQEQLTRVFRVLVPLDGSPFAEAVLPYVEFLAQRLSLEVVLVRVLGDRDVYAPFGSAEMAADARTAEIYTQGIQALEEECARYLEDVASRLSNKGLESRWEVLRGPVSPAIANLAQELTNNMIALASHGRSGLARWVLGSVAEELLRGTGDPVLIVPSALVEDEESDER